MPPGGGGTPFPEFHARLSASLPPFTADRPEPQGYVDILAYLTRTLGAELGNTDATLQSPSFRYARVPSASTATVTATGNRARPGVTKSTRPSLCRCAAYGQAIST